MSEQNDFPNGGVRRVSPKDRKPDLASGGLQFPPPDDDLPELPSEAERFPPLPPEPQRRPAGSVIAPVANAPEPRTESEARFPFLAQNPLEEAPLPFDDFDATPAVITPPEERFPPLPPSAEVIEQPIEPPTFDEPEPDGEPEPDPLAPPRKRSNAGVQNAVAVFFLLASIAVFVIGMIIFTDPYGMLNPFPPPTPPPIFITATFGAPVGDAPGPTASFTPLPAALLTEMAPTKPAEFTEEVVTPAASAEAISLDAFLGATAVAPAATADAPVVGGG